jgi:hypothetical protein
MPGNWAFGMKLLSPTFTWHLEKAAQKVKLQY